MFLCGYAQDLVRGGSVQRKSQCLFTFAHAGPMSFAIKLLYLLEATRVAPALTQFSAQGGNHYRRHGVTTFLYAFPVPVAILQLHFLVAARVIFTSVKSFAQEGNHLRWHGTITLGHMVPIPVAILLLHALVAVGVSTSLQFFAQNGKYLRCHVLHICWPHWRGRLRGGRCWRC